MKYTINTYGINGKLTVLQDNSTEPLYFESEEAAKQFLRDKGYSEEYIEDLSIESEDNEQ